MPLLFVVFSFTISESFFLFLHKGNLLLAQVGARVMSIDLSMSVQKEMRGHAMETNNLKQD